MAYTTGVSQCRCAGQNHSLGAPHTIFSGVKQVLKNASAQFDGQKIEIVKFTFPKVLPDEEEAYQSALSKFAVAEAEMEDQIALVYEIINQ
ncbi:MAG TPA: hypothetical protein PKD90_03330 [Phnomibacter sp.]|nr:hypothetical protein [Phnomibacter sp.]